MNSLDSPFEIPNQSAEPSGEAVRTCARKGCDEEGNFRAPVSRNHLDKYYWFCLEHVREYNAAWDYYAGLSAEDIERQRRRDATWQRPSWPFAGRKTHFDPAQDLRDDFELFGDKGTAKPAPPKSEKDQALALFSLDNNASFVSVKARYKELVKQLHPDANGGDPRAEERLKVINQAYSTLKAEYSR